MSSSIKFNLRSSAETEVRAPVVSTSIQSVGKADATVLAHLQNKGISLSESEVTELQKHRFVLVQKGQTNSMTIVYIHKDGEIHSVEAEKLLSQHVKFYNGFPSSPHICANPKVLEEKVFEFLINWDEKARHI